jgi:hypothetical protein
MLILGLSKTLGEQVGETTDTYKSKEILKTVLVFVESISIPLLLNITTDLFYEHYLFTFNKFKYYL